MSDRAPQVGDEVYYFSIGLGKPYKAKITQVHKPGNKNSPVDLTAYNPADRDEIWKPQVTRGQNNGQWDWTPPEAPAEPKL